MYLFKCLLLICLRELMKMYVCIDDAHSLQNINLHCTYHQSLQEGRCKLCFGDFKRMFWTSNIKMEKNNCIKHNMKIDLQHILIVGEMCLKCISILMLHGTQRSHAITTMQEIDRCGIQHVLLSIYAFTSSN